MGFEIDVGLKFCYNMYLLEYYFYFCVGWCFFVCLFLWFLVLKENKKFGRVRVNVEKVNGRDKLGLRI